MADSRYIIDVIIKAKESSSQAFRNVSKDLKALEQLSDSLNKSLDEQADARQRLADVTSDQIERQRALDEEYSNQREITRKNAAAQLALANATERVAETERKADENAVRGRARRAVAERQLTAARRELTQSIVDGKEKEIRADIASQKSVIDGEKRIEAARAEVDRLQAKRRRLSRKDSLATNAKELEKAEKRLADLTESQNARIAKAYQVRKRRVVEAVSAEVQALEDLSLESAKKSRQDRETEASLRDRQKVQNEIIDSLNKEAQKIRESGFVDNKANSERTKNIEKLRESFKNAGGDLKEFDEIKKQALSLDNTDAARIRSAFNDIERNLRKAKEEKTRAFEAAGKGNEKVRIDAELNYSKAVEEAQAAREFLQGIFAKIKAEPSLDLTQVLAKLPELEAIKKFIAKDENFHVEADIDNASIARVVSLKEAFSGLGAAVTEGLNDAGKGVSSFDNLIRGLLVLTVALFFQQILVAAVGLAAGLTALASSAIAAGAALGGALAAGAAQALPAIGVIGAFVYRLTNILGAVKQANLLQQQESYKGAQAATKQASSLNGVISAQERVKAAQDAVTESRKKARQALEDLIIQEQRQSLTLESAQEKLNKAINSGNSFGVAQAQLDVQEAKKNLGRNRTDLATRRRQGIEGSPEVTQAQKALKDAQRGLEQAKQSATQAGSATLAAGGKLNFLLTQISSSEKKLYEALVRTQQTWIKFSQQITQPLTVAATGAVNRIDKILKSSKIISLGKEISTALAGSFKQAFDFLLSDSTINRLIALGKQFTVSLQPITRIAINLAKAFLNIAELGGPSLQRILLYLDKLVQGFTDFTDSVKGKNLISSFFSAGTSALIKFADVLKALGKLIFAIIGTPGSGLGLDAGNKLLDIFIKGLNDLANGINNPNSKLRDFFKRFFKYSNDIVLAFVPIIKSFAGIIDKIFTKNGIDNVKGFADFISTVLIPAFGIAANGLAQITTAFVNLTKVFPFLKTAATAFFAVIIGGGVLSRISALANPFKTISKYLFTGAGKNNIFRIAAADADKAKNKVEKLASAITNAAEMKDTPKNFSPVLSRRKGVLAASEKIAESKSERQAYFNSAGQLIDPGTGRYTSRGKILQKAESKTGRAGRIVRKTPILGKLAMGAGLAGGTEAAIGTGKEGSSLISAGAGLAGFAEALGPIGLAAAGIAVVVAAVVALIAISGRLGDVWKAIKQTFEGVFSAIKDATGELAKELTGENSPKAAFDVLFGVLKKIGSVFADILIPAIKILGVIIGQPIVAIIKIITAFVKYFKNAIKGIKQILHGDIIGGIKTLFEGLKNLLIDVLLAPFRAMISLIGKIFPGAGGLIKGVFSDVGSFITGIFNDVKNAVASIFTSIVNTFIKGINFVIKAINAIPLVPDVKPIDEMKSPQQKAAQRQAQQTASQDNQKDNYDRRRAGRAQPRTTSRSGSQTRRSNAGQSSSRGQSSSAGRDKAPTQVDNQNAEKFLSSFNPETVKLSGEITKKISRYWQTLRREARTASNYVIDRLGDIKKDGGKYIDRFVDLANQDFKRMRNGVRTNMVGISNIVQNQMFNAKKAVYDAAVYMKNTLNDALKSVGSSTTIKLSVEAPKKNEAQGNAVGGWIGNRGERGRDMVPTMLGRGEAVLNWGHQKLVEPALRQTYGFGLDDMFNRTNGYHAGGPRNVSGLARGGRLFRRGKASWFGGPNDGMNTGTAIGLPDTAPGIALYNQSTLGKYFDIVSPQHRRARLRQIDIGPAPWTGKILDITSAALKYFGFTEGNFPTGVGTWSIYGPFGGRGSAVNRTGGASASDIVMPAIKGGTDKMRELVKKGTQKMIDAANRKLEKETPTADIAVGASSGPAGTAMFDGHPVAKWIIPILRWARGHGWQGSVNSGYRTAAEQQAAAQNYGLQHYGPGGPQASNHRRTRYPGGAVDVSNSEQLNAVLRGYRGPRRLIWAGPTIGDYVHFSGDGHARGGFVGLRRYASGGHIGGPEGQPVPIMAHAGEWVLNRRQQNMIAGIAGTTADRLKGMLGFSGGPTSFGGGGSIRGFKTDPLSIPTGLLQPFASFKTFETELEKAIKFIARAAGDVLNSKALKKQINKTQNRLDQLKKGPEDDKQKKQIDDAEKLLKNLKARKDLTTLIKSIRQLTGTDGESGALGSYAQKIKKQFDDLTAAAKIAGAGFEKVGNKIKKIIDPKALAAAIDPATLADKEAAAQAGLVERLVDLRNKYADALASVEKASSKVRSSSTIARQLDKTTKAIDKLSDSDKKSDKEKVKKLEKQKKELQSQQKLRQQIDGELNGLRDRILEKESEIADAEQARVEAEQKAFEERTKQATRAADQSDIKNNLAKSIGELTGNTGAVTNALQNIALNAKDRLKALETQLASAQAKAAKDPRWQSIVDDLQQQVNDASIAVVQTQADIIDNAISGIEATFQKGETRRGLSDRMAAIADKLVAGGGNATRMANLVGKGSDLAAQRDALIALRDNPNAQINEKQRQELNDRIAELNTTIAENTQEVNDFRMQIRQQAIERITGISTRTGGLLGNAGSIFENINRALGQPNTANQVSLAESLRTALGLEGTSLAAELNSFLSDPNSTGLLGSDATAVLQQLLAAFSSGDPGSFATVLQGLAPQIATLESTLGETAKGPFTSFIDSLVNNTIAVTDNTANLQELNGLASQPQPFSTTAWTRFRNAIFNGIGDVLPQYNIPQMATGGQITKGGLFQLHPGEFVVNADKSNVNQGDINITVNEANKPLDVTALASRIAFEKRNRR